MQPPRYTIFVFDSLTVSADKDTINYFVSGQDKLVIDQSVFSAFASDAPGALLGSAFALDTKATTVDQHLIYNSATGALFYDADGVGGVAQIQIAALTNRPTLAASDFQLEAGGAPFSAIFQSGAQLAQEMARFGVVDFGALDTDNEWSKPAHSFQNTLVAHADFW